MEVGNEIKGICANETNLRKPKENGGFQWSEEPGGAQTEAKMEPWEVRAGAREPWALPSGQSWEPEEPVVSHMEAQGRPRSVPDTEMDTQRAEMESAESQKESKGAPKRPTGRAK